MPGTSAGSRTTYMASRFCVPASVRSKPLSGPPSNSGARCRRSASGPLPGRGGAGGQVVAPLQPAGPGQVHDQVQPIDVEVQELAVAARSGTVSPNNADTGGSNVLTALNAATSTRATTRPTARSRRNAASASTSGSSGTGRAYGSRRRTDGSLLPGPYAVLMSRGVRDVCAVDGYAVDCSPPG